MSSNDPARPGLALVTGASSGIGLELARVHAARGGDLVLVARRHERLARVAADLRGRHGVDVHVVAADLGSRAGVDEALGAIARLGLTVDVLVNGAGLGERAPFADARPETIDAMIGVNVAALTSLTRAVLPGMIARGRGRVLHVASMAAFAPGPSSAVYHATKAYVLSLGEALAEEVRGSGVTVTTVCPGATATEFAERAGLARARAFARPADPADVAAFAYASLRRGDAVAVPGLADRVSSVLTRWLPRRLVTHATGLALRDGPTSRVRPVRSP